MTEQFKSYFEAMLWTCKSCGFVEEGGQPEMECPLCEAYKTDFINIPQHIEKQVRQQYEDLPPNHKKCRTRRIELMKEENVFEHHDVAGRVLPTKSGTNIDPSLSE